MRVGSLENKGGLVHTPKVKAAGGGVIDPKGPPVHWSYHTAL